MRNNEMVHPVSPNPHKVVDNNDHSKSHKSMCLINTGDNYGDTSDIQHRLLFNIRNTDNDKPINSVIFNEHNQFTSPTQCVAYDLWSQQLKVKVWVHPTHRPSTPDQVLIESPL